jgi:hypothetical protein
VTQFDIVSGFLKPIDNPIPVDRGFNANLNILAEGLEKPQNLGQVVWKIGFLNLVPLSIGETQLGSSCMQIDPAVILGHDDLLVT